MLVKASGEAQGVEMDSGERTGAESSMMRQGVDEGRLLGGESDGFPTAC